ncbi:MAG: hypothetical protein Q9207_002103 [Kuettlingeria erythrocarpa]
MSRGSGDRELSGKTSGPRLPPSVGQLRSARAKEHGWTQFDQQQDDQRALRPDRDALTSTHTTIGRGNATDDLEHWGQGGILKKPMRIEANYAKAARFIQDAASKGAQLAVLPEYHLTNWVPDDPKFGDICGQWEIYLAKYRALAKEHNICIVPGTIVERHQDEEDAGAYNLLNVAYFIGNKGEILGRYQKKNLWWRHPSRTLTDCSEYGLSVNPRSEALFLESTITSRTFENTCAVVFVNAGGPAGSANSNYAGLSRVAVPFLGALGDETKDSSAEGMSIVDLDMKHIEEAEANYKVRQDLAREDWYYTYRSRTMAGREKL